MHQPMPSPPLWPTACVGRSALHAHGDARTGAAGCLGGLGLCKAAAAGFEFPGVWRIWRKVAAKR